MQSELHGYSLGERGAAGSTCVSRRVSSHARALVRSHAKRLVLIIPRAFRVILTSSYGTYAAGRIGWRPSGNNWSSVPKNASGRVDKPLFTGELKIMTHGEQCMIRMYKKPTAEKGDLTFFAGCPIKIDFGGKDGRRPARPVLQLLDDSREVLTVAELARHRQVGLAQVPLASQRRAHPDDGLPQ